MPSRRLRISSVPAWRGGRARHGDGRGSFARAGPHRWAAKERVDGLLRRAGLPTEAPRMGAARALELMRMDKKVLAGKVRLVLLERLGSRHRTCPSTRSGRWRRRCASTSHERRRLAGYAAHEERLARPAPRGAADRPTARSISATATASSIPPRFAAWYTRLRCSSTTRATSIGRG